MTDHKRLVLPSCDCSCFNHDIANPSFQGPCVKLPYTALGGFGAVNVDSRRIIPSKTVQIIFSLEIHAFKPKADSQRISLQNLAAQI